MPWSEFPLPWHDASADGVAITYSPRWPYQPTQHPLGGPMIAHISIGVRDLVPSKRFYDAVLEPLGYKCLRTAKTLLGYGYGRDSVSFWIFQAERPVPADARSTQHLFEITERVKSKGVALHVLDLGVDTSTATGKLLFMLTGLIATFERELMLERQREGIARAKAEGKYKGRKPTARARA